MKKYIRTKGGVYEVQRDDENENSLIKEVVVIKDGELTCLNKRGIIAQADTIDELCDEFVAEKYGNRITFPVEDRKTYETRYCVEYGWNIYGAIWTTGEHGEPILKSVARMNEKGELELL